ncbi:MAG: hypothetical protein KF773_32160 [Deltaproteobacteria bacterium]|nr:hypothetical protein [Deltaproteobacteria bacterium]MCW5808032.1 hypothetical protein [Deltaproteobacteria bacterium]
MNMCAIYTAVPPPTPEEQVRLARENEGKVYGAHRCTVGRRGIAELVAMIAPRSRAALAQAILERDLWGFLTPAASRGNHAATLARAHEDLAVPMPLWPMCIELACLVGAEPARYLGNNLAMLPPELVDDAVDALATHEEASEVATYINEFLRKAQRRRDAVLLHWDLR